MKAVGLEPHPEGGHFREIFRSQHDVESKFLGKRSTLTHIYYKLESGECSKFHKVSSEEVWNLYKGEGIRLYQWDGESSEVEIIELSDKANQFCHVVPAHSWQAAEPIGDSVLVGCSVAPGFEFQDFTMMKECSGPTKHLTDLHPQLSHLIS